MTSPQFLLILRARWLLIAGAMFALAGAALAICIAMPKRYTAELQMLIDAKASDPILGSLLPPGTATSYMATQVDLIGSDRVAQGVVRRLKFDQSAAIRDRWVEETHGKGSLEAWYGRELKKHLGVVPTRDSNLVTLSYTDKDPQAAADIANAFASVYAETNLELRVEPAKQYAEWFDERTRHLREKLEWARKRLSDYQQEHGIVATDEKLDLEAARLAELSTQLVQVQGFRADARSRHGQARAADTLPEVLQNPLVQSLKTELARREGERDQLAARVGAKHPDLAKIEAEIALLRDRIATETQRIAGSLGTSHRINAAREAEIQAALAAQKQRVLKLRAERDAIAVLQREVESAQRAFDMVTQRYSETSLESEARQASIAVLSPATEPARPSSPKPALNAVLGGLFGALLGTGLALLLELFRPRVRGVGDLVDRLGVPVLAELPDVARRSLPAEPSQDSKPRSRVFVPSAHGRALSQQRTPNAGPGKHKSPFRHGCRNPGQGR